MNVSVERLRVWLLAGAGLLLLVIAAFLGYAHYRTHRFLTGLPGKLGADIRQETNGFTYSQSNGPNGRTIYTIHAAKMVQRKDGRVTLDDVGIVLYGRGDGSSDRVDRIYGSEFEYDQNAGVVRAMGEVHIDLQAPAPADANARANYAAGHDAKDGAGGGVKDERLIHVKTSGLVFLQKLGVAATDQDLEFEFNGMIGHAHGADYNSDTGLLVLQSAVKVSGLKQGEPVVLTAGRAALDRHRQQVLMSHAVYTALGGETGARVAKGERVTAYLRREGSVERVTAEGGVSLTDGAGGTATAERGEVHLSAENQPQMVKLAGAVRYAADAPLRQARGEAEEGRAGFDRAGQLEHVVLTGAVHLHERTRSAEAAQGPWNERDLAARELELGMAAGRDRRLELREATATGDARLTLVNPPAAGMNGATTSALSGDVLTADLVTRDGGTQVKSVHAAGHTALRRVGATGATETSSGDTMDADFRGGQIGVSGAADSRRVGKSGRAAGASASRGTEEITTASQQGHVVMTNLPVGKGGATTAAKGGEQRATADRAVYDGATGKLTLTGSVQVSETGSVVWADRVVMEQTTGDAVAEGAVKASYAQAGRPGGQQGAGEVMHVLAARGELKHDAALAIFYGGMGSPARLWQGASQVTAPVLQFEQRERRMVARGDGRGAGLVVHAVFVSAASAGNTGAIKPAAARKPVPVRVASHEMTYSDAARRADFGGGVLVEDADGTMRARQAAVYLQAAGSARGGEPGSASGIGAGMDGKGVATGSAFLGGSVERAVVSGGVMMVQPGRRMSGEQVVYTASDGMFVMTGSPGVPPKMMDEARGTITGASLRFHAGDNSVVVSNGPDSVAGERVRTETRVKQ
jgi:lipopolysaccharide export system protein LptA